TMLKTIQIVKERFLAEYTARTAITTQRRIRNRAAELMLRCLSGRQSALPRRRFGACCSQCAVLATVGKVDREPDHEPDEESQPVGPAESVDHGSAHDDTGYCDHRQGRNTKCPLHVGTLPAHDPHSRAHENEREKSSDARHFTNDVLRQECGEQTGENEE